MIQDTESILKLYEELKTEPLTPRQIADRYGISERTAYRWVAEIEKTGAEVHRVRSPAGFAFSILK